MINLNVFKEIIDRVITLEYDVKDNNIILKDSGEIISPYAIELKLLDIFSNNERDIIYITLYEWLYKNGMTEIKENWYYKPTWYTTHYIDPVIITDISPVPVSDTLHNYLNMTNNLMHYNTTDNSVNNINYISQSKPDICDAFMGYFANNKTWET